MAAESNLKHTNKRQGYKINNEHIKNFYTSIHVSVKWFIFSHCAASLCVVSVLWLYHKLFTHSATDGGLGCFQFKITIGNTAMNILVHIFSWTFTLIIFKNVFWNRPIGVRERV